MTGTVHVATGEDSPATLIPRRPDLSRVVMRLDVGWRLDSSV